MMIKTNVEQLEELKKNYRYAKIWFTLCFVAGFVLCTHNITTGPIFLILGILPLMVPLNQHIRYVKNRQDAMIRIFCDNLKGFEDDLNNPCYWMEGEDADPDEYVPSGDHNPEDPSIK